MNIYDLKQIETSRLLIRPPKLGDEIELNIYYDESYSNLNLLFSIFGAIFKKDVWTTPLCKYPINEHDKLSPIIASMIKLYMPIALLMGEFLEKLRKENKSTPFPSSDVEALLSKIKLE